MDLVEKFKSVTEAYVVEKIVEVVITNDVGSRIIRIEAVRGPTGRFSTHGYEKISAVLQPTDIVDGKPVKAVHHSLWVTAPLPWTDRDTADAAIEQCLSLMEL